MDKKNCFINSQRPCELSCRAAFPTDNPLDPVGCVLVWLVQTTGEASEAIRDTLDAQMDDGKNPKGPGLN